MAPEGPTSPTRPTRMLVEVVPGSDPIAGTLSTGSGPPERFAGWMELTTALERARAGVGEAGRGPGGERTDPESE